MHDSVKHKIIGGTLVQRYKPFWYYIRCFYWYYAGRYMRIGKYPRSLIGNMDETSAFFDMISAKSICKTGSKEGIVHKGVPAPPPLLLFKAPTLWPSLSPLFKIFISPPLFSVPPPFKVFYSFPTLTNPLLP